MSQAHDDAVDKRKAKTDEIAALREEVTTPHASRHFGPGRLADYFVPLADYVV